MILHEWIISTQQWPKRWHKTRTLASNKGIFHLKGEHCHGDSYGYGWLNEESTINRAPATTADAEDASSSEALE